MIDTGLKRPRLKLPSSAKPPPRRPPAGRREIVVVGRPLGRPLGRKGPRPAGAVRAAPRDSLVKDSDDRAWFLQRAGDDVTRTAVASRGVPRCARPLLAAAASRGEPRCAPAPGPGGKRPAGRGAGPYQSRSDVAPKDLPEKPRARMAEPQPNSGKILYLAVALLVALSALFGLVLLPRLAPGVGGMVGAEAPDVTLPVAANGEAGARMQIAELKGQPVILGFLGDVVRSLRGPGADPRPDRPPLREAGARGARRQRGRPAPCGQPVRPQEGPLVSHPHRRREGGLEPDYGVGQAAEPRGDRPAGEGRGLPDGRRRRGEPLREIVAAAL